MSTDAHLPEAPLSRRGGPKLRSTSVLTASLLVVGCGIFDTTACTGEFVPGIRVEALTIVDRVPITEGLAGTVTEGAYSEELEAFDNFLFGAYEREGTYDVTVTATGYEPWTETGVVVTSDECHVRTVLLEAELTPTT